MIWGREDAVKVVLDQPTNSLGLKKIIVKGTLTAKKINKR